MFVAFYVEEPLSERAYQNKSPDSQEVLVPGGFLSCMPWDEEILDQELEKSSSAEEALPRHGQGLSRPPPICQKLAARKGWT